MEPSLSIEYQLTGTGWASCKLVAKQQECLLTASYLTDAFGKLVASAVAVMLECRSLEFSFDEEPGEYRWVLDLRDANVLKLEVLEFESLWGAEANEAGKSVFKLELPPLHYVIAVYVAAEMLLEEHGVPGYEEKWSRYPFPKELVAILKRALHRGEAMSRDLLNASR